MLEKECDAILNILKLHPVSGYALHQCSKDFIQKIGMTYPRFRDALDTLKKDNVIETINGKQFINDSGLNILLKGGYSAGLLRIVDSNPRVAESPIQTVELRNEVHSITQRESENATQLENVKLKWLGSPSQFGFIIQELIGKGFIQKPAASYTRDASIYLKLFEIDTTPSSLAKEISTGDNQNSLSSDSRTKFRIPSISQLK